MRMHIIERLLYLYYQKTVKQIDAWITSDTAENSRPTIGAQKETIFSRSGSNFSYIITMTS